jgi:hypothetical protein
VEFLEPLGKDVQGTKKGFSEVLFLLLIEHCIKVKRVPRGNSLG